MLVARIHRLAVGFVVPPRVAEIGGLHICSRMNMADHALARRNGSRETMADRMAGFILRDGWVGRSAFSHVSEARVRTCMFRRAIVCVHDVAGRAAAAAIVAWFVVGAGQREHRIEQTRFLKAEKNGIGAKESTETALAELVVGAAGLFFAI